MDNSTVNLTVTETSPDNIGLTSSLFICLLSINLLFGLPTHSYVIWLIITGAGSGIALEFFTLNLSVCEIGICLNCVLNILAMWFLSLKGLAYFLQGLLITGRPMFQCMISIGRYVAVVHPVLFLTLKQLVVFCIVAWIITLGSCFCCMFLVHFYHELVVHTWLFSMQSMIFLSIQLFCCLVVLRVLKQSGPGERGREREEENHMKKRAFHLITITTVTMVFTYLTHTLAGLYNILINHYIEEPILIRCFLFVEPVLYMKRAGKLTCFCST